MLSSLFVLSLQICHAIWTQTTKLKMKQIVRWSIRSYGSTEGKQAIWPNCHGNHCTPFHINPFSSTWPITFCPSNFKSSSRDSASSTLSGSAHQQARWVRTDLEPNMQSLPQIILNVPKAWTCRFHIVSTFLLTRRKNSDL